MRTDRPVSPLAGRAYAKMNGIGNEILVLDLRSTPASASAEEVRLLAGAPGLAFDQLMAVHDPRGEGAEAFVRIYNADGSDAGACGNGSRCVAWYLMRGTGKDDLRLETVSGPIDCVRLGPWRFMVDMGRPRFAWSEIPVAAPLSDTGSADLGLGEAERFLGKASLVNMGNPHAIFWVDHLKGLDVAGLGARLERHPLFPERANISFARVRNRRSIELAVWERGAGQTRACGSAACAVVVAAARANLCEREAEVDLPGGRLSIHWREDDHVTMTGPCELESEGRLPAELFQQAGDHEDQHA